MYPTDDDEYRETTCTAVKDGALTEADGLSFGVDPSWPVQPRVGSTLRFYGKGFGWVVRGLYIDGQRAYYRTPAEEEQRHAAMVEQMRLDKIATFEKDRPRLDAEYAALPPVFQRRIDRFRAARADWRPEYEAYEMSCCVDAVKIAAACKTTAEVEAFQGKKWEEQNRLVPGLFDGHSGNSFGMACRLAWRYLSEWPETVAGEHGALTPLVGCDGYGCTHTTLGASPAGESGERKGTP